MAEKSLILELQELASTERTPIPELLRKSLLVASKLNLEDFRQWINHELNGYSNEDDVPKYRYVQTQLKLRNPYHGLIPFVFDDPRIMHELCNAPLLQGVGGLNDLLVSSSGKDSHLILPFRPRQMAFLMEIQGRSPLEPVRIFGKNQIAEILDVVRTTVLQWALDLESKGVMGIGMTFSSEEKAKAHATQNINIQNFQGVMGNVSDSTVTQELTMTVRSGDFQSLSADLAAQGISPTDLQALKQAIESDPKPANSEKLGPAVSTWIGSMVSKAASGALKIGAGAASQVIVKAISLYYGF